MCSCFAGREGYCLGRMSSVRTFRPSDSSSHGRFAPCMDISPHGQFAHTRFAPWTWGETSTDVRPTSMKRNACGRIVYGAKYLVWGETSMGRTVRGAKSLSTECPLRSVYIRAGDGDERNGACDSDRSRRLRLRLGERGDDSSDRFRSTTVISRRSVRPRAHACFTAVDALMRLTRSEGRAEPSELSDRDARWRRRRAAPCEAVRHHLSPTLARRQPVASVGRTDCDRLRRSDAVARFGRDRSARRSITRRRRAAPVCGNRMESDSSLI